MNAQKNSSHGQEVSELWGDEVRLKQVLINLVKNALKFTTKGHITVELSYDSIKGVLHGFVRDSGRGIAPEDMPKLFSRFGKLARTADVNNEGIGLGLTIVKLIVQQHNGDVNVESPGVNKGSTFSFWMKMGLFENALNASNFENQGAISLQDVSVSMAEDDS